MSLVLCTAQALSITVARGKGHERFCCLCVSSWGQQAHTFLVLCSILPLRDRDRGICMAESVIPMAAKHIYTPASAPDSPEPDVNIWNDTLHLSIQKCVHARTSVIGKHPNCVRACKKLVMRCDNDSFPCCLGSLHLCVVTAETSGL